VPGNILPGCIAQCRGCFEKRALDFRGHFFVLGNLFKPWLRRFAAIVSSITDLRQLYGASITGVFCFRVIDKVRS
jgi:hypothetical protein